MRNIEVQRKVDAARATISALCLPKNRVGHREWLISIPARPEVDPDLVISAALQALEEEAAAQRLRADEAEAKLDRHKAGDGGPGCMDCGRPYPHGLDMVLTKAQWLRINPLDGGVLCPSCIVDRAAQLPEVIHINAHIAFAKDHEAGDSLEQMLIAVRLENADYSRRNAELERKLAEARRLSRPERKSE